MILPAIGAPKANAPRHSTANFRPLMIFDTNSISPVPAHLSRQVRKERPGCHRPDAIRLRTRGAPRWQARNMAR